MEKLQKEKKEIDFFKYEEKKFNRQKRMDMMVWKYNIIKL